MIPQISKNLLVTQCAWCAAFKIGPLYFRVPGINNLITVRLGLVNFTHGICPSCARRIYT